MGRASTPGRVLLAAVLAVTVPASPAFALWPQSPTQYLTLLPGGFDTNVLDACADGAGGAYVCWVTASPVYADVIQHLDAFGETQFVGGPWSSDPYLEEPLKLVPGDRGGLVTLSVLGPNGAADLSLAVHAIGPRGQSLWLTTIGVIGGPGPFDPPATSKIAANPAATEWTVAWLDGGPTPNVLRAQRVDALGNLLWGATGAVLDSVPPNSFLGSVVVDASGGAWISYFARTSPLSLRVQYVRADGSPAWTQGGVLVASNPFLLFPWQLVPDGTGGAWLSWSVSGAPDGSDRIQRIRADGALALGPDGIVLPGSPGQVRGLPSLGATSGGRVLVSWQDAGYPGWEKRASLLDSTGTWLWPGEGTLLGNSTVEWLGGRVFVNGDGSATMTVDGACQSPLCIPGALRLSASGGPMWPGPTPTMVGTDWAQHYFGSEFDVPSPVPTGDGGVMYFATLADSGMGSDPTAYFVRAQRLDGYGRHGDTAPRIVSLLDTPDDLGGWLTASWRASSLEGDATMPITGYDVLRADPDGSGGTTLKLVAQAGASGDSVYVAQVPTLADSTSPGSPPTTILVRAHDGAGRTWLSSAASGSSFPNSPPLAVGAGRAFVLALAAPEPNPVASAARIRYTLPEASAVTMTLTDVAGRRMRTLVHAAEPAGEHVALLAAAAPLPAGLYFVRLEVPGHALVRRAVVLR